MSCHDILLLHAQSNVTARLYNQFPNEIFKHLANMSEVYSVLKCVEAACKLKHNAGNIPSYHIFNFLEGSGSEIIDKIDKIILAELPIGEHSRDGHTLLKNSAPTGTFCIVKDAH